TDLSELNAQMTDRALELVRAISGDTPLRLRALLVVEHDPGLYPALPEDMLNGVGEMRLSAFLDKGSELRRGVESVVRVGRVRDEIIAEATDWPADLLVAGTHGRRGASRLFIGSVAEALLRGTTCDMLVIPASA